LTFLVANVYLSQMKNVFEPREIVKENAAIYREREERRMDFENYHHWLFVKNNEIIIKEKEKKMLTSGSVNVN